MFKCLLVSHNYYVMYVHLQEWGLLRRVLNDSNDSNDSKLPNLEKND